MSVAFWPPSYRAGTSDLSIQISPLGLVDLSNEEMDVHGIRLSRYSLYWAHYLGHHWAYRREIGEPQFTFNYVRALSDYLTNFTFGRGVTFQSPPATSAIVPAILKRVWEQDNRKASILWEMGQIASVTGDLFVKVAYEDPFVDSAGRLHPGRVRILPLNPANCFPQWHEHDRQRMLSFKLKYRFFSTDQTGTRIVNTYIERITDTGIEEYVNDELISARPNPLGVIPIVYVPNILISGSPWGMSDIAEIIPLNREYNEKAVEISDIVNYHSAPVTVITGAKVPQLEKGARKTWFLPKDAKVETLQSTWQLEHMLGYMDVVKRGMHEMTGVPEQALGQVQPISNTSGVALAIQYAPTMQRFRMKKNNFESGFQQINELVILTLFQKEPQSMMFNPWRTRRPSRASSHSSIPLTPTATRRRPTGPSRCRSTSSSSSTRSRRRCSSGWSPSVVRSPTSVRSSPTTSSPRSSPRSSKTPRIRVRCSCRPRRSRRRSSLSPEWSRLLASRPTPVGAAARARASTSPMLVVPERCPVSCSTRTR